VALFLLLPVVLPLNFSPNFAYHSFPPQFPIFLTCHSRLDK